MKIELVAPIYIEERKTWKDLPIPENLSKMINGRVMDQTPDDEITQYFIDQNDDSLLKDNKKFIDGYFSIREIDKILYLVATFNLKSELNELEKNELFEFTSGQFSDGLGQSFCSILTEDFEFNIENDFENIIYLT